MVEKYVPSTGDTKKDETMITEEGKEKKLHQPTILNINGREVNWDKQFPIIREICDELVTEDYVKSCLNAPVRPKGPEYERPLTEQPKIMKSLTMEFRSIIEYHIKSQFSVDKNYGRVYERTASEARSLLSLFGVQCPDPSDEIYKKIVDKIVEKCG
jgi:hypothetical protein